MAAAQVPGNERGMEHISQRFRNIENKLGQVLDILEGRAGEARRLVNVERERYSRLIQDITAMFKCPICLDLVRFPAIVHPSCRCIIGCAACVVQIVDNHCPLCRGEMDNDQPSLHMPNLTDRLSRDQDHLRNEPVDHSANAQLADAQPANL